MYVVRGGVGDTSRTYRSLPFGMKSDLSFWVKVKFLTLSITVKSSQVETDEHKMNYG